MELRVEVAILCELQSTLLRKVRKIDLSPHLHSGTFLWYNHLHTPPKDKVEVSSHPNGHICIVTRIHNEIQAWTYVPSLPLTSTVTLCKSLPIFSSSDSLLRVQGWAQWPLMFSDIIHPPCELSEGQLPVCVSPGPCTVPATPELPPHSSNISRSSYHGNKPFFNEYNLACPGSSITYTLGEQ